MVKSECDLGRTHLLKVCESVAWHSNLICFDSQQIHWLQRVRCGLNRKLQKVITYMIKNMYVDIEQQYLEIEFRNIRVYRTARVRNMVMERIHECNPRLNWHQVFVYINREKV